MQKDRLALDAGAFREASSEPFPARFPWSSRLRALQLPWEPCNTLQGLGKRLCVCEGAKIK